MLFYLKSQSFLLCLSKSETVALTGVDIFILTNKFPCGSNNTTEEDVLSPHRTRRRDTVDIKSREEIRNKKSVFPD